VTPGLLGALEEALGAAVAEPVDAGTIELARAYAGEIDSGGDLVKLGPLLLAALVQLRMTPAARMAVLKGGVTGDKPASKLDELRARRARKD
jgi:hypothetical protein